MYMCACVRVRVCARVCVCSDPPPPSARDSEAVNTMRFAGTPPTMI